MVDSRPAEPGHGAAPLITGWLEQTTGTYAAPMYAILIILLIGIASYLVLVRKKFAP